MEAPLHVSAASLEVDATFRVTASAPKRGCPGPSMPRKQSWEQGSTVGAQADPQPLSPTLQVEEALLTAAGWSPWDEAIPRQRGRSHRGRGHQRVHKERQNHTRQQHKELLRALSRCCCCRAPGTSSLSGCPPSTDTAPSSAREFRGGSRRLEEAGSTPGAPINYPCSLQPAGLHPGHKEGSSRQPLHPWMGAQRPPIGATGTADPPKVHQTQSLAPDQGKGAQEGDK